MNPIKLNLWREASCILSTNGSPFIGEIAGQQLFVLTKKVNHCINLQISEPLCVTGAFNLCSLTEWGREPQSRPISHRQMSWSKIIRVRARTDKAAVQGREPFLKERKLKQGRAWHMFFRLCVGSVESGLGDGESAGHMGEALEQRSGSKSVCSLSHFNLNNRSVMPPAPANPAQAVANLNPLNLAPNLPSPSSSFSDFRG